MNDTGIRPEVIEEIRNLAQKYDIVNLDRDMQDELRESIEKEGRILYEKIWKQPENCVRNYSWCKRSVLSDVLRTKNRDRRKLAVIISEGIESERKYPLWDRYTILKNWQIVNF